MEASPTGTARQRLPTLDLIRGVAVLGILTINIAGFAGPMAALTSPNLLHPAGLADEAAFALNFVFFEGKMRALFSLLFGAGLALYWERTEATGGNGDVMQVRRLSWLMLLGMLHYLLLWWGDILFLYAVCGLAVLILRPLSDRTLLISAFSLFFAWHIWGLIGAAESIGIDAAVRSGTAHPTQVQQLGDWLERMRDWADQETYESRLGFTQAATIKLTQRPFWLFQMVERNFAETLPLMLIGMALYRRGFFEIQVRHDRMVAVAIVCTAAGLALSSAFVAWAWLREFPPLTMQAALVWGMAFPRLLCGIGYSAVLVLISPLLAPTRLGQRLSAAGRTAFSNYILTSIVMTFLFKGWGLGLFGTIGAAWQWVFVIAGWAMMLAWSEPWLRRYQRGPLEWIWRCLVERRWLPNRVI